MAAIQANQLRRARWLIASLVVFLLLGAAVMALLVTDSGDATEAIRREMRQDLLVSRMLTVVEQEHMLAADTVVDPGLDRARAGRELAVTASVFDQALGELREAAGPATQQFLNELAASQGELVASIEGALADGSEDVEAAAEAESVAADLRRELNELHATTGARLEATVREATDMQPVLWLTVPLLLLGALLAVPHLIRERRKSRRLHALEDLVRAKDEYIGIISHELRTPLTGIVGFADVLQEDEGRLQPDERAQLVNAIAGQSHELEAIVEDLLVAARSELGELNVKAVPVNLKAQTFQVVENLQSYIDRDIDVIGDGPRVIGDPSRVRQILRNLITNAFRYGGPNVVIEVTSEGASGSIRVKDDGAPIAAEDVNRIFEPYKQARSSRKVAGSVGLGLTVCRRLAHLMGGALTYEHRDGWGYFELSLPVAAESDQPSPAGAALG